MEKREKPGIEPTGVSRPGRWIRPVAGSSSSSGRAPDASGGLPTGFDPTEPDHPALEGARSRGADLVDVFVGEARQRLRKLAVLERDMEDRIRSRWRQVEAEIQELEDRSERELTDREKRARADAEDARRRARKEGRAEGFREGFEKGAEEGRRLGFEQGRLEGLREGRASGRQEEEARLERETTTVLQAVAEAAREFEEARERLLHEAQAGVLRLASAIARKIIQAEVRLRPDAILGPVEKAVELIFRGCDVTLELHPGDARYVENVLEEGARWAEDMKSVRLRPSPDIERGGCRLLSGAGIVDLTVESQLELVEDALLRAIGGGDGDGTALGPDPQPEGGSPS